MNFRKRYKSEFSIPYEVAGWSKDSCETRAAHSSVDGGGAHGGGATVSPSNIESKPVGGGGGGAEEEDAPMSDPKLLSYW
jgi:hypothetical protein